MSARSKGRGFEEISVWKGGVQRPGDRFIHDSDLEKQQFESDTLPFLGVGLLDSDSGSEGASDSEEDGESNPFWSRRRILPRTASWRLNLTALSSRHNLYFAAYGDAIYCYRPLGIFQKLHRKPHFIITLPRSESGKKTRGVLDQKHPHDVNHLIVREFGSEEILVVACDDGDIIAYQTQSLENFANRRETFGFVTHDGVPRPFFHEHVGMSAWGLDVHQKSRLIATSSNLREVQIFCFGIQSFAEKSGHEPPEPSKEKFPTRSSLQLPRLLHSPENPIDRECNFRILKPLDHQGHNIPCISFTSLTNGEAESIVATDVRGNLWDLPIWDTGRKLLSNSQKQGFSRNTGMGWGVLVLPSTLFLRATTRKEAFGFPLSHTEHDGGCDITSSLHSIPDNSLYHPKHPGRPNDPHGTAVMAQVEFLADDEDDSDFSDGSDLNIPADDVDISLSPLAPQNNPLPILHQQNMGLFTFNQHLANWPGLQDDELPVGGILDDNTTIPHEAFEPPEAAINQLYHAHFPDDSRKAMVAIGKQLADRQTGANKDSAKRVINVPGIPVPLEVTGYLKIWDLLDKRWFPDYTTRFLLKADDSVSQMSVLGPSLPHLVAGTYQAYGRRQGSPYGFQHNSALALPYYHRTFGLPIDPEKPDLIEVGLNIPDWVNGIPARSYFKHDPPPSSCLVELIGPDLDQDLLQLDNTTFKFIPILELDMPYSGMSGLSRHHYVNLEAPMTVIKRPRSNEVPVINSTCFVPIPNEIRKTASEAKQVQGRTIIFHTYNRHMRILAAPGNKRIKPVYCNNAVYQALPEELFHLNQLDRLTMLHPIPELNLIIAGSQVGRVALLTMTRLSSKLIETNKILHQGGDRARYGMRLERILPTSDQEDKNMRPYTTLLGIAVAPLQDAKGRRERWRLMLHYQDFTILTYLLERVGENIKVDVKGVLV